MESHRKGAVKKRLPRASRPLALSPSLPPPPSSLLPQKIASPHPNADVSKNDEAGKVDKSSLHQLIVDGDVDIEDLPFKNINAITRATSPTTSSAISDAISRILCPRSNSSKHSPGQDNRQRNKVSSAFVFLFVDCYIIVV